ncbi:MAG: glycoside hydrolase, partial [Ginsengibacter sp.]
MRKYFLLSLLAIFSFQENLFPQKALDSLLPVRGFCIGAPKPRDVDNFTKFIEEELATRHVNTLIVRVDYRYQFKSHPELIDSVALSSEDIK